MTNTLRKTSFAAFIISVSWVGALQAAHPEAPYYKITDYVPLCERVNAEPLDQRLGRIYKDTEGWLVSESIDIRLSQTEKSQTSQKLAISLHEALKSQKIALTMLPVPNRGVVLPEHVLNAFSIERAALLSNYQEQVNALSIFSDVVDITKVITELPQTSFFKSSPEWTPSGAAWFAYQFASQSRTMVNELPKPERVENVQARGSVRNHVESVCGYAVEPEYFPMEIASKDRNESNGSLVLLGDNLSAEEGLGFSSYLSAFTGLHVDNFSSPNRSDSWGWKTLAARINAGDFQRAQILWQFSPNELQTDRVLGAIYPAITGGCDTRQAVVNKPVSFGAKTDPTEIYLPYTNYINAPGDMVIEFSSSVANVEQVEMTLWLNDGTRRSANLNDGFDFEGRRTFYLDVFSLGLKKQSKPLIITLDNVIQSPLETTSESARYKGTLAICGG